LALTLAEAAPTLREHEVARVVIGSMYRPGSRMGRSGKRSQHGHALAADVVSFHLQDGRALNVERDWHGQIGQPACGPESTVSEPTEEAIRLRNLVCALARQGLFHYILTPNYDTRHHDHVHFDIKRDARHGVIR
jgi:hypothetical protein